MAIMRYRPLDVLSPLSSSLREFDELTNRLRGLWDEEMTAPATRFPFTPAVNVEETADALLLTAELPGLTEENVEIDLENNVLTIRGEKTVRREEESEDHRYHVWERRYGGFQRSFTLPRTVKGDEISATFRNGVLEVHMPKVPEAKGRKIAIKKSGK